ncbi:MAG: Fic family protein [Chitinophagales bacterium]|nr:Fic family protein [Chitinophagales bacterium]
MSLFVYPSSMEPIFPEGDIIDLENIAIEVYSKNQVLEKILASKNGLVLKNIIRKIDAIWFMHYKGFENEQLIDILLGQSHDQNIQRFMDIFIENAFGVSPENIIARKYIQHLHKKWNETMFPEETNILEKRKWGAYRIDEVKLGNHQCPAAYFLDAFLEHLELKMDTSQPQNKSLIRRIIQQVAFLQRFMWIHPFDDHNLVMGCILSHQGFQKLSVNNGGWSLSKAVFKKKKEWLNMVRLADMVKTTKEDGTGNLSNAALLQYCNFVLTQYLVEIDNMIQLFSQESLLERFRQLNDLLAKKKVIRKDSFLILEEVIYKGSIQKMDVDKITGRSDKTAKAMAKHLVDIGLLHVGDNHFAPYTFYADIKWIAFLFPELLPAEIVLGIQKDIGNILM